MSLTTTSFSTTAAQYFYAIGLGRGWQLASGPVVVYDWKADSDDALTFPLGLGVAKTAHIGSMTWKFELQAQYFAEQPGTSDWTPTVATDGAGTWTVVWLRSRDEPAHVRR